MPSMSQINFNKPLVMNSDGSFITNNILTFPSGGRFFNVPLIVNGKKLDTKEALQSALIRRNAQPFDTLSEAILEAEQKDKKPISQSMLDKTTEPQFDPRSLFQFLKGQMEMQGLTPKLGIDPTREITMQPEINPIDMDLIRRLQQPSITPYSQQLPQQNITSNIPENIRQIIGKGNVTPYPEQQYNEQDINIIDEELIKLMQAPDIKEEGDGESLYHETGDYGVGMATSIGDASGLNVSIDKDLALGQGGKGFIIEFDKSKLLGEKGSLRPITKPGSEATGQIFGQQEFRLVGGTHKPSAVKSIIVKPEAKANKSTVRRLLRSFPNKETLEDGTIILRPFKPKGD